MPSWAIPLKPLPATKLPITAINATLLQTGNKWLPFGGIGNSGMGLYHGKSGFETFSTTKSIFTKPARIDPGLSYPPYKNKVNLLKWLP